MRLENYPFRFRENFSGFYRLKPFILLVAQKEIQVDVRILSATNKDLAQMVREGRFREDLYHRLRVSVIHAPSLRERRGDIPSLVNFLFIDTEI